MPTELILLCLLWLVPIIVLAISVRLARSWAGRATGIALGAIIAPALFGLYGLYFVGPIAALVGLIAFPLAMLHGAPGYDLALALGIVTPATVVEGHQHFYVALLNGVVWAVVYGLLGWLIDFVRATRQRRRVGLNAV